MRQLVKIEDTKRAELFSAVLYAEGIENKLDPARDGGLDVWVHDEREMERARALLAEFEANPFDPRFQDARTKADTRRKETVREDKLAKKRVVDPRRRWQATSGGIGFLTMILIGICTLIFIVTFEGIPEQLGTTREKILSLLFIDSNSAHGTILHGLFADVRQGEVWRLITPIFGHGGFFHFLFNMWWLKDFGTMIERRQSSWYLGALVLACALVSNCAQYLVDGPAFLGMSGVVYGLFGFIWIRGYFDPASGYGLPQSTVILLLAFFVIGFTGLLSFLANIANTAHAGGLAVGMAWGFLSSGKLSRR
jgi:GlpG protein